MSLCVRVIVLVSMALANAEDAGRIGEALGLVFDAALDVYAPVSPALGDGLCRKHGVAFREGVRKGQTWALHMLDASSKLPSGLLAGNLVQLGNVDQCLAVRHTHPEHGPIRGQHCLVSLGIVNVFSVLKLLDKFNLGGINGTGLEAVEDLLAQERFSDAVDLMGATWSLCVPASCSPGDLERHLRAALPGRLQVRVEHLACGERQGGRPWGVGAILVGTLLSCIGLAVLAGTAYDLLTRDASEGRDKRLLAFSIRTNGEALLKVTPGNAESLHAFDGLRCLTIFWTVLVHHFIFVLNSPTTNFRSLEAVSTSWSHLFLSNGTFSTDSFLFMSGTLVAFTFMRDRDKGIEFRLWRFYLNRYVRLSPTYAVSFLITATMLGSLSVAPLVRINEDFMERSCAKIGWTAPFFVSNYVDTERTCAGQAWSTSVDMQLFWLSPLLLFPLWRTPRLGFALLLTACLACTGTFFYEAYQLRLPLINILHGSPTSVYLNTLYYKTHLRATPWLIGVALGCLLHNTKGRTIALSRAQTSLGWTVTSLVTSYLYLGAHAFFQPGVRHNRVRAALHVALMRPAWALVLSWVLFACEKGYGGFVNTFLAWRGWQVPSRLSYAIAFTHYVLVMAFPLFKKTPQHYDDVIAAVEFLGLFVLSVCAGVVLHLTVEVPAMQLYRLRMGRESTLPKKDA